MPDDLQTLPQGEISFAIVTPRRADPAFVFIMDVNQDTGAAESLIDRGREFIKMALGVSKHNTEEERSRPFRNCRSEFLCAPQTLCSRTRGTSLKRWHYL